jgi:tRNA-splicing ligase RtcB (3'-phosphate/5'-hydroxy nucleic acid ligase)
MEKIFANNLDKNVLEQFQNCMKENFVIDGALMPDAHYGYVAPIGSVIITKGVIVPSWVGYDIGCGVIALKLSGKNLLTKIKKNSLQIQKNVKFNVPMGLGKLNAEHKISKETKQLFNTLLQKLEKSSHNNELFTYLKRKALSNLGTLGQGNHFIEIDYVNKEVWIVIHSGSRNMGHKVASYYMQKAMWEAGEKGNSEKTFALDVSSQLGKEYLAVQNFLLEFALLNRIEIANKVLEAINEILGEKVTMKLWANKNHNHAERIGRTQKFIHRKGATPSNKGEKGVIPANMRDGTFLVIGKGDKDFLNSSSHGAGRAMSKKDAKAKTTMKQFTNSMKGITATITKGTLDESPFAYKDITTVMKAQEKSIKIYKHLLPLINFKGESEK